MRGRYSVLYVAVGERYGRWLVIEVPVHVRGQERMMVCRCDCGRIKRVAIRQVVRGHSQSCGCLRDDVAAQAKLTHGHSRTRTYKIWQAIKQRCTNPKTREWKWYGGMGVTLCERWHCFENFIADVGERPSRRLTLDRIDPWGNYEPGNVRWATWHEQAMNKRRHHPPVTGGGAAVEPAPGSAPVKS